MIVEAFAKGDKGALRPLLADEVFAQFAGAIDAREQAGRAHSTELVATRAPIWSTPAWSDGRARVTVRFTSEQVNLTRDAAGEVVEGDPRQIDTVIDTWTFERDTRSRDPNWQLVETGAPAEPSRMRPRHGWVLALLLLGACAEEKKPQKRPRRSCP